MILAGLTLGAPQAGAQVVTDGSVGPKVSRGGAFVVIEDSLGARSGGNLFHSFTQFSTVEGTVTVFGVPSGVDNVIGRVTGPDASALNGLVSFADGETLRRPVAADFWLFNPNGIMVGPNASFRTSAALYFSGGDSVIFSDGATFSADLSQPLTITSAAPEAFGFLTRDPGPVVIRGANIPLQGDGIALSGGRIVIDDAILTGENEALTLIAGGKGDIAPIKPGETLVLTSGKIRISGGANANGQRTGSLEATDGGDIRLYGGEIVIDGGRAISVASRAAGGDIDVAADRLVLRNGGEIGTLAIGDFNAGRVDATARDIALRRGAAIRSQTQAAGNAGAISVTGFDRLLITRGLQDRETAIESEVAASAAGDAGLVLVRGGDLRLIDGGGVFSNTFGDGDAGAVDIGVRTIVATDGGQIGSGARDNPELDVLATGAGGTVTVRASESMDFSGTLRPRPTDPPGAEVESSGILSATEGQLTGPGGDLFASAPLIIMRDEAEIGAETFFTARAGDLTLQGGDLIVSGGAEISTTSRTSGAAGNVALSFSGAVDLPQGGSIASRAQQDQGSAGRVDIRAARLFVGPGSRLTTDSLASDGGAIIVRASQFAFINGGNVTTSVASSEGDGGSIDFRGGPLALGDAALIESRALAGDGGEVTISSAITFIETPDAAIDVSSAFGQDGVIRILGVVGDQTSEADAPPAEFFNRFALIDDFCVAAVTGGSALRLVPADASPLTASLAPALFGGAIPYPASAGGAADLSLNLASGLTGAPGCEAAR